MINRAVKIPEVENSTWISNQGYDRRANQILVEVQIGKQLLRKDNSIFYSAKMGNRKGILELPIKWKYEGQYHDFFSEHSAKVKGVEGHMDYMFFELKKDYSLEDLFKDDE